ncbi:tripartite tricarboxylate transporter substrate binding protein [Vineibacter terrae]|uniref:Tripartite tricarboxylate transporter substrate binding protein n=1 Tax=Vineibacter terrae TaxID=2586908 RepID=A0A5C8P826_9HYPH|nr:tripartite tricarboxylate transporter substrate binding protein [Vineibacter terrae]TXL69150.1 tripartite tricarboxylate transporter substrate binding protein [Vineibacter terrae]
MPDQPSRMPRRRALLASLAAASALAAPSRLTAAQDYPDRPITLVVPFPPGAVTDRVGRSLAAELGRRLGQQVIVDNVGGASGTLAGKKVLGARPDGYTLLLGTVNDMVLAPIVMRAGYAAKDFTPIAKMFLVPTILVANPSLPADTADAFIEYARRARGPIQLGATGLATLQTFGGVMLADAAGFKFEVVPYRGGGPLLADLVAGQIQVATISLSSALALIRQGKLKSLGLIALRRDPTAPELPTVNEGRLVRGIEADLWGGLAGPPGLAAGVQARLSAVVRDILADPAFREAEARAGTVLAPYADPGAFAAFLAREHDRLAALAATVKVE